MAILALLLENGGDIFRECNWLCIGQFRGAGGKRKKATKGQGYRTQLELDIEHGRTPSQIKILQISSGVNPLVTKKWPGLTGPFRTTN
jgi:hypothetical protein